MATKHLLLVILGILLNLSSFSQDQTKKPMDFFIGLKERVTSIPLGPQIAFTNQTGNIQELSDERLSGVAFMAGIKKKLSKSYSITFTSSIRRHMLYRESSLNQPLNPVGYSAKNVRKTTFDIHLDAERAWQLGHFNFFVGLGFGIFDLNSGYTMTRTYLDANNQPYYVAIRENYMFATPAFLFGFEKKKISGKIQFNYAPTNPGFYESCFILPEIKLQYSLFSFGK